MGAPVLEKGPYIFNVNNLFTESNTTNKAKRILLELKNCLVNLGGANTIWTVVASSNGVDFVNIGGDEPFDLWNSISDIVNAANGSPHSWCVLENLFTGQQLIIAADVATADKCEFYVSPGGTIAADGSASNNPTATDYGGLWYTGTSFTTLTSTYTKFVINVMTSADYTITRIYVHERSNTTGEAGGKTAFIENAQGTPGEWNSAIKFVRLANNYNVAFSFEPNTKTPKLSDFDGASIVARYQTAEPYDAWVGAYPTCECYSNLLSAQADPLMQSDVGQAFSGGHPITPIGIFNIANPKGGSLGRLTDIYLGQAWHDTLDTFPSDGSRLWVKWGCFVVPWNGTIPQDAM